MKDVPTRVSEVSILPLKPKAGLLGFASFVLNVQFYLGEIAIRSRTSGGIRLLYPTKKLANGKEVPLYHPITKEIGNQIEQEIASHWGTILSLRDRGVGNAV